MNKIASFQVDHTKIGLGMYISRIDGDITTYDIRMAKPNGGVYLEYAAIHTIEHLFATYARNTEFSDSVIYVGPMGCRTGFYFLTRSLPNGVALKTVRDAFAFVAEFDGVIPGSSEIECGNFLEHDLDGAKKAVLPFLEATKNWTEKNMAY